MDPSYASHLGRLPALATVDDGPQWVAVDLPSYSIGNASLTESVTRKSELPSMSQSHIDFTWHVTPQLPRWQHVIGNTPGVFGVAGSTHGALASAHTNELYPHLAVTAGN